MKSFIFLSPEGVCFSPDDNVMENFQVIGTVEDVPDKKIALTTLLDDNSWIEQFGYDTDEFICLELKTSTYISKNSSVSDCLEKIYNQTSNERVLNKATKADLIDFVLEVFNKGILKNYLGFYR
ncbi:MAG: hypothetical protein CVT95_05510 [Bacteroidetes bacterium HGW-Bacteroidetes-12]|nr:MAG: hypothetical protein CVT95_05510 [Bacteroidetes bacterium HGW-Bacteroidetes-12]